VTADLLGVEKKDVTAAMMVEFKAAVTKLLTPHASAILLDAEYGLEASKQRSKNAGLLLAYEKSGYDNTQPGRLPDLLPHVSVKRIVDWGANAVKVLIYYSPFEYPKINDIKHAFIERVGAECVTHDIPFFLELLGYDAKGGDDYNQMLSERRALAVKKYLVDYLGVPDNLLTIIGRGETELKLPSQPYDAQNRRVQVINFGRVADAD